MVRSPGTPAIPAMGFRRHASAGIRRGQSVTALAVLGPLAGIGPLGLIRLGGGRCLVAIHR